jgi:hypothetical protein
MNKLKYYIIVGLSCLLVGRYVLQPEQKVEIKEVIKYVEKKQESTSVKKKTTIKEIKSPDGTSTTETTVVEDSSSNSNTSSSAATSTSTIRSSNSGITLGMLAIKDLSLNKEIEYGVLALIPIVGNLSLATTVDTSKRVGVGLSLKF